MAQSIIRKWICKILASVGWLSFPLGIGAMLGFYAADQGMRWLPTMLKVVLAFFIFGSIILISERFLAGEALRETTDRKRLRKRIIALLVVACLCIAGRLALYRATQPSPLTDLTQEQFNKAFELDAAQYEALDQGMETGLAALQPHRSVLVSRTGPVLSPDMERLVLDTWKGIHDNAFALDQVRIFYEDWYRFDPSRVERPYHLKSFLLTFAAELSLYEKCHRLIELLQNENAVKFLNAPHKKEGLAKDTFSRFLQEFAGVRDQSRVLAGQSYLYWLEKALAAKEEARGLGCIGLWSRIENHLSTIQALSPASRISSTFKGDVQAFKRSVRHSWYPTQRAFAEWMGDTRTRRSGQYLITREQQETMDPLLEPGDIMLSRKNWYLSNVGLPGFWPHAILYIGAPDKLESYFDGPEVKAYIKSLTGDELTLGQYLETLHPKKWYQYKQGDHDSPYRVIEAISPGVVLNTLEEASGDYLAALRPRLDRVAKAQAVIAAFASLGKPYDFDFDFATDHALVCTEVVWRSYRPADNKQGLDFPLVEVMGRQTLPANEIAGIFLKEHGQAGAQMDFVYFIDAREKSRTTLVSDEGEFLKTFERTKWDIALE